ncbi:unnamed protein product [Symbiodinium natans]|uniref:Uncharacterized protein n=1 Tax=Symbiodinium natans TaxID=878477 RepID=A0A812RZ46_9DINO|nr:unnamed protein product [Symbiodinium natans]
MCSLQLKTDQKPHTLAARQPAAHGDTLLAPPGDNADPRHHGGKGRNDRPPGGAMANIARHQTGGPSNMDDYEYPVDAAYYPIHRANNDLVGAAPHNDNGSFNRRPKALQSTNGKPTRPVRQPEAYDDDLDNPHRPINYPIHHNDDYQGHYNDDYNRLQHFANYPIHHIDEHQ